MTVAPPLPRLLPLAPQYKERVWGGQKLHISTSGTPIGEAWIAYGQSTVSAGPVQGQTLDALMAQSQEARAELLGEAGQRQAAGENTTGFPLLIKLLDCADWLSVQVHPNDEQALAMVGPGERGKTEAWHMLQAAPDAQILAGVKAGVSAEQLAAAIRGGTVLDVAEKHKVAAGDTVFIPAGTLHALGPGLLLYEIQESSDTTYRVYDWNRPASAGRALHIEQSVAVTKAELHGDLRPERQTHGQGELTSCEYFVLDGFHLATNQTQQLDTQGQSFQIITAVEGQVELSSGQERLLLGKFQTALVTAAAGKYSFKALGGEAQVLLARLPQSTLKHNP